MREKGGLRLVSANEAMEGVDVNRAMDVTAAPATVILSIDGSSIILSPLEAELLASLLKRKSAEANSMDSPGV